MRHVLAGHFNAGAFWKLDIVPVFCRFHLSFVGFCKKKPLQMVKKLVKVSFLSLSMDSLVSLWQQVSNTCQSILVFLIVIYDEISKHWVESSPSVGLRFSFFISFVLIRAQLQQVKIWKDEISIPALRVYRHIVTFSTPPFVEIKRFRPAN